MERLTEQVTFKVTNETLKRLKERGRQVALDANPYARKLVEEGLDRDATTDLADELRELAAILRPLADQLGNDVRQPQPPSGGETLAIPKQIENLSGFVQQLAAHLQVFLTDQTAALDERKRASAALANQAHLLRSDLNKTFAALLHYQMGFTVEDAQRWVDARLAAKS